MDRTLVEIPPGRGGEEKKNYAPVVLGQYKQATAEH
jgi:hypothetical protein